MGKKQEGLLLLLLCSNAAIILKDRSLRKECIQPMVHAKSSNALALNSVRKNKF